MQKLGGWFNPEAQRTVTQAIKASTTITGNIDNPDTNEQSGREIGVVETDIRNVLIDRFHHDFAD